MPDDYFGRAYQVVGQVDNVISVRTEYDVQWEHKRGNGHEPLRLDCYFNYIVLWRTEPFNTHDLLQIFNQLKK